jgi:hypothetical protein
MKANHIFRPLAKFLRAARAFLGDFERPPFLPASVKNARTKSIGSAMCLFYHTRHTRVAISTLNGDNPTSQAQQWVTRVGSSICAGLHNRPLMNRLG